MLALDLTTLKTATLAKQLNEGKLTQQTRANHTTFLDFF